MAAWKTYVHIIFLSKILYFLNILFHAFAHAMPLLVFVEIFINEIMLLQTVQILLEVFHLIKMIILESYKRVFHSKS